jgi:hypothetical protein
MVEVDVDDPTTNVRDVAPWQSIHQLPRLLITPELDQPDHEDQSLQAIEEPARIIDAVKILRI